MKYAFVLAASLLLTGCDDVIGHFGDSQRFKEDFRASHALSPGGRVALENSNGSVEIFGWDQDTVEITAIKYASTEDALNAIRIEVTANLNEVRIRTTPPIGRHNNWGARYTLHVPRKVVLDRIVSSNGSVRLESLEGSARLQTSNGAVRILKMTGPIEIRTSNGGIDISDSRGSVVAHTSNGKIQADDVRGNFEAVTSNGSISARLREPEPQRTVRLQSSNGSIDLTLDALRQNDIRISTSNSGITLRMPGAANANLRARTSNSSIQTEFDVNASAGRISKHEIYGSIGSGGPTIDLSTSNGGIKLLKL